MNTVAVLVCDLWLRGKYFFHVGHKKVIRSPCVPLSLGAKQLVNASLRCDLLYHHPMVEIGLYLSF